LTDIPPPPAGSAVALIGTSANVSAHAPASSAILSVILRGMICLLVILVFLVVRSSRSIASR